MKGKEKRKLQVQELLVEGYTQEKIAEKLNVSISTVERDVRKLRGNTQRWLDELFPKKMVQIYREGLDGIQKDMMTLRDMLEEESVKTNIPLRLKILKDISELREQYYDLLHHTPMIWSLNQFIRKNQIKSNDGKPPSPVYGERYGYEYREPSNEVKSYTDPHYENKFKN